MKMYKLNFCTLLLITIFLMNCSIAAAYSPKIYVEIQDPVGIYNPEITHKLTENLKEKLKAEEKFIISDKEEADFFIEGKLVAMGIGRLLSNVMGTSFTLVGSASSLFVSPFTGPVISAAGFAQTQKNVFAIAVRVNVIRLSDEKVMRRTAFLGRNNLKKREMPQEILEDTINQTIELISKKFIKDINKNKPKIFSQQIE